MIHLENGLGLCNRVTWGWNAGYIIAITSSTYRVRWLDGEITTKLRPDLDDEDDLI